MTGRNALVLRRELRGHRGDVRGVAIARAPRDDSLLICTASRDRTAALWKLTDHDADLVCTLQGHSDFVNTVTTVECDGTHYVITGSADRSIKVWAEEDGREVATNRTQHSDSVCSLASDHAHPANFLSGSWDHTASLWRLDANEASVRLTATALFRGHTAAVWTVAFLISAPTVVTGSADKSIRLWDRSTGDCLATISHHQGPVRALSIVSSDMMVSASNDGSIALWNVDVSGRSLLLKSQVLAPHGGHFIYTVDSNSQIPPTVASGGEDNCLSLFSVIGSEPEEVEIVRHPGTVWAVGILPDGDILTGCSDGVARIFTRNPTLAASEEELARFVAEVGSHDSAVTKVGGSELSSFEDISVGLRAPGAVDGEQKIVRHGSLAEVHKWNEAERCWVKIGDVVPDSKTGTRSQFDYQFDVEVGQGGPMKTLGYNAGEDPSFAAQRFIEENDLSPEFLEQIQEFIVSNVPATAQAPVAGSAGDPLTGASRYVPSTSSGARNIPGRHLPWRGGVLSFQTSEQGAKIAEKLEAINTDSREIDRESSLGREDMDYVKNVLIPSVASGKGIQTDRDISLIQRMLDWTTPLPFPLLDVARLSICREEGAIGLLSFQNGSLVDRILLQMEHAEVDLAVLVLGLRFLCNLFVTSTGKRHISRLYPRVLSLLLRLAEDSPSRVVSLVASLVINVISTGIDDRGIRDGVLQAATAIVRNTQSDENSVYLSLVAIGSLMTSDRETTRSAISDGLVEVLAAAGGASRRARECVEEIESLIS